mmetsp:Transcript_128301/g.359149  ORF Transcript_128301/g.359149 Transcript_128301/m.359149 type:complete len:301 (-) Transcript_128301:1014-1916(-)
MRLVQHERQGRARQAGRVPRLGDRAEQLRTVVLLHRPHAPCVLLVELLGIARHLLADLVMRPAVAGQTRWCDAFACLGDGDGFLRGQLRHRASARQANCNTDDAGICAGQANDDADDAGIRAELQQRKCPDDGAELEPLCACGQGLFRHDAFVRGLQERFGLPARASTPMRCITAIWPKRERLVEGARRDHVRERPGAPTPLVRDVADRAEVANGLGVELVDGRWIDAGLIDIHGLHVLRCTDDALQGILGIGVVHQGDRGFGELSADRSRDVVVVLLLGEGQLVLVDDEARLHCPGANP